MNQPISNSSQEAWLEMLEQGMVTIPQRWRDELGMQKGMCVKAKKEGKKVIIETQIVEAVLCHLGDEKANLIAKKPRIEYQRLDKLYQIRNSVDVWHFLEGHPHLVSLLIRAHDHMREYFPTAEFVLEYTADPEIAGEEQLLVVIAFGENVDQDHDTLQRFNHDWWFDVSTEAFDDICIILG
jgi:bifunctional DNA-binding transcriptional regulator/antitoxin component of YhaV-PrlF toxin-antitoxin module